MTSFTEALEGILIFKVEVPSSSVTGIVVLGGKNEYLIMLSYVWSISNFNADSILEFPFIDIPIFLSSPGLSSIECGEKEIWNSGGGAKTQFVVSINLHNWWLYT